MTKSITRPRPSFIFTCGKLTLLTAFALLCLTLAGCAKEDVNTHGHILPHQRLTAITVGETTEEGVRRLLGSPPLTSSFQAAEGVGQKEWIYITETASQERLGKTTTQSREICIIRFDKNGLVANVTVRDQSHGRDIDFSSASTPTSGQTLGVLEQALGNLGIRP